MNGQITEYTLSPEQLAEIHKKYGPPNIKPDKHDCFISANRKPPLVTGAKKKPKTEKVKTTANKPSQERKPRKIETQSQKRQLTKEELESALEKGGTLDEARKILRIGNDVMMRFIRQYGIVHSNRHLIHRDEKGKVCGTCKSYKSWSEFNKNKSMIDGYESNCRECSNAYRRARMARRKAAN